MARDHSPMAGGGTRRKQAIRDQKKPGARQIPKGRERKETTMEGGTEKQIEGQLCPHGSRCCTNQMPPHRTSGKAEEGRTMFSLRSPRTHVQGMPKEAQ